MSVISRIEESSPSAATRVGDARPDGGDLAEPPLLHCSLQAVENAVLELLWPGHLAGIGPELRASDTRFSELAGS
ncbi:MULTISPECIES: hypothetical protein [unclassified Streptomyces]|uniref:hypothetical protein n=1 Tax=unclassified Streptomyces TaxID=2593676 RepID=UPI002E7FD080|nr:hypothetical protein [Streptomyces sp. NBC_00589]WTI33760.1 hypothetical protein OIC96_01525 [Streptomyces sp. NBC_00775]WUB32568.1 hypothetical protein OHA51_48210 [Streptomyces sp. NBC_00589]